MNKWINKVCIADSREKVKSIIKNENGIIDGIWFFDLEWRIKNRIRLTEKDFYAGTYRIKSNK